MTQKHFDAIIAKNQIARLVRQINRREFENINELPLNDLAFQLQEIEKYIGQGNQPSVYDIMNSEMEL
jgi:hypothetical protein